MSTATSALTPSVASRVLAEVCRQLDVPADGARSLRYGENALFHLPVLGVIVRIGRSIAAANKEVAVARWLADQGYPAARIAAIAEQPVLTDGFPVTFWSFLDEDDRRATSAELGTALRTLHALTPPADLGLPAFSPMPKVRDRLRSLPPDALSERDVSFLHERLEELEQSFENLTYALPMGPVHGDAHAGNLLRLKSTGAIILIDFEDFCSGPREWDVAVETVRYKSMGWVSGPDYRSYVESYGFDPLDWDGYPRLRDARELNMTTWLMQQAGESQEIDSEIAQRLEDLRYPGRPRRWHTF